MDDNILNSIKQCLMIPSDVTVYDPIIMIYINSTLLPLTQVGVGNPRFILADGNERWSDFLTDDNQELFQAAKQYISINVRLLFDPPNHSYVIDAHKAISDELLYRLKFQKEALDNGLIDSLEEEEKGPEKLGVV